jgi:hypothetical protein
MSKWTKGEWVNRNGEIGIKDTSDTQSYGMMLTVANVDKYDFEEWEANAKLIAQAPVLAEMIASIVNNAPSRGPLWHGSKEINEASKTLQDAGYYD